MIYAGHAWGIALLITSALPLQSSFSKLRVDVAPQALQTSAQSSCNRGTFRIILDVGHTAEEPGAISARGVPEFAFNLRLAQYIKQQLVSAGFAQTEVLVAAGTSFSGLLQRMKRVNRIAPNLFLSIHHDSVPEAFLEAWEYEGVQQHFSDRFSGRGAGYPAPPPQIPACGLPAPGSCRRSNVIDVRGLGDPFSFDPRVEASCDTPKPALCPGRASASTSSSDWVPSFRPLRPRSSRLCSRVSPVLWTHPTPRLFPDSFAFSASCRGPGSLMRLRARRGLPGSDAFPSCVMWPQTPAGRRVLA